jgi:hypothetical protein
MSFLPMLLIALGAGICRGKPPRSQTQGSPAYSEEDQCRARFLPLVGSTIRVTGFIWPGKPGPGVTFKGCPLYLKQATIGPKLNRFSARTHQKVTLRGIMGHFEGSASLPDDVQRAPEYFYIEVQQFTLLRR